MTVGPLRSLVFIFALAAVAAAPRLASAVDRPPPGFAAAYLAGHIAERRGDTDVAARELAAALDLAPETPALRRRVMRLQLFESAFDEAAAGAEALAADGDDNFPIGLVRLVQRFRTGAYEEAVEMADDPRAHGLSSIVALLGKAWARAGAGGVDAGAKLLTDAGRESTGLKTLLTLHAGLMAEQAGRTEVARWMFEEALQASQDEQRPASGRLIQIVAGFFDRQGLADEAAEVRSVDGAVSERPEDTAAAGLLAESPAAGFAEALYNVAGSLFADRQHHQALIYARLSLSLRPDDPATAFTVGQILEGLNRPEDAAAAYRATPASGSFGWRAQMSVAESLSDAGRQDDAIEAMRKVLELAPEEPAPAISLGHLLRSASRFKEAVEAYDEAIRRKGGLDEDDGWLRYARGVALERSGDWPAAEQEFLAALDTLGDEPLVLNYLGYTWIDRGEHLERGRAMVARAVELRPDDGFIRDSLGWAEYRMGDFDAAAVTLERAVALQPLDPIINEHLGDAYWRVGRLREARFQWRRALSFEPEPDQVPEIEEKLRCGLDGCPAAAAPAKTDGDGG